MPPAVLEHLSGKIDRAQARKQLDYLGYKPGSEVFLRFFYHSDDPRKDGDKGRKLNRLKWAEVENLQSQGRGVYVVVNGSNGGHLDSDITQTAAIFCEWDDLELSEQLLKWESVGFFEPTYTVFSGDKSAQPYWVFDEPLTDIEQWRELQSLLIEVMGADPSNKNPSRVFRLAGGWHIKPGREPRQTEIVQESGKRYNAKEMLNKLRELTNSQYAPSLGGWESISLPVPESVPLDLCLSKESRSLLSGVSEGGRNSSGAALARDLIGTASYLNSIGQSFEGDAMGLLQEFGSHCNPPLPVKEIEQIWKSAVKDRPGSSCPPDVIENCIKAWYWREHKSSGRGYSSGLGGNRRQGFGGGSGGDGGDGGDDGGNRVIKFPGFNPLGIDELAAEIDKLIIDGVSGSELRQRLNALASVSDWHITELYKLHGEKLKKVEQTELRDNTRDKLEALLNANNASLDLNQFLHPHLAKPLLHLASRLSLKPEVYLTTLLTTASSLHDPKTRIWLSKEDDFDQPAGLYSAIIAPSSQKKSPVLKAIARKPLKNLEREEMEAYKQEKEAYERAYKVWSSLTPEQQEDTPEPDEPPLPGIYIFSKANGEGLERQVPRQPDQGMLWESDELAGLFNSQNAYRGGRGSDRQDILSYYDGTGGKTLRADGVKSAFDEILLSIIGGVQPKVIEKLLADCEDSDGNWARFLFVNQPAVAGRLHPDGGKVDLTELLTNIYRKIRNLPEKEYELSPEAFKLFQTAYDRYEQNRVHDPLIGMQAVWGKCEGRAGRLALNLHVLNSLANGETPSTVIDAQTMKRAIALTDYYAMQVKAMYTEFSDSDGMAPHLAKVLDMSLKRLTSKSEGWLKASDIYLSITKSKRPSGETVREWFSELVTLGKGEIKGQGRSIQFRAFNPKLDKIRQELDKSSNTESYTNQWVEDKLDKLDKLDNFPNLDKTDDLVCINGVESSQENQDNLTPSSPEKNPVLDESSNLSKNSRSDCPVRDAKLDTPSNESSNLDDLDSEPQREQLREQEWRRGQQVTVSTDIHSLKQYDGQTGIIEAVKHGTCLVKFQELGLKHHIPFRCLR